MARGTGLAPMFLLIASLCNNIRWAEAGHMSEEQVKGSGLLTPLGSNTIMTGQRPGVRRYRIEQLFWSITDRTERS